MQPLQRVLLCVLGTLFLPFSCLALATPEAQKADTARDGQYDFDFTFGTWKTHISRLQHPLTGSTTWVQIDGTKVARKVWDGRAALEEIEADGPTGHWESLSLFLYNPNSHQWSLNFANSADGTFSRPAIGEFKNGRGEFYDQEEFNGRAILVRIVWSEITPSSHRFEQSFSPDGGKSWEPNFIAVLTRDERMQSAVESSGTHSAIQQKPDRDPQHDFDWEFGDWTDHVSRLVHPLTGSSEWVELNGNVKTRQIWEGRANLAEIELDGPSSHIEFLSLRLYNPKAHQWSLNFASSNVGTLSVPMIGEFKDGRGEFYDQETFNDRTIFVRFLFLSVSPDSGRSEQAFSDDGGKTWETNWVNTYTRQKSQAAGSR